MDPFTMTVIIPTYKPDGKFQELLRRLMDQTVKPKRILIVNTEEKFYPAGMLSNDTVTVLHIKKKDFDHGGTRDMAARMADTDLLVFMTMDAVPADRFLLERLQECFRNPLVAAAYARQLPTEDCSFLEAYTRRFNYGEQSFIKSRNDLERLGVKTFFCSNVCAAYRRESYLANGGFERKTIFNEDMIFAGKLIQRGLAIAYCAEAQVIHSHNYSGAQQFHRNFDLGVSQAQHPEVFQMAVSESEGKKMVKKTAGYLLRKGRFWLLPVLFWQSTCKYLGYKLGKAYESLPESFVKKCTMNPSYWTEDIE